MYDNSSFDESLKDIGFYVLKDSKSNYNRTAFSISSTLNFDYLKKIKNFSAVSPGDYEQTILTTKESIVPKIFITSLIKFRQSVSLLTSAV